MKNNIADLIKKLRKENNLSQEYLAELCNYSKEAIAKVEQGVRHPSKSFLIAISIPLNFDFITYVNEINNFKCVEHYTVTYNLIKAISTRDNDKIGELINTDIVKKEFNYGEPLAIKQYCQTLLLINVDNNATEAYKLCMSCLEIDKIETFKPEINKHYWYYSTIVSLVLALNKMNDFDNQLRLCITIIDYLENVYFNNIIPFPSVDVFYRKYYVLCLNNLADTYFTLNDIPKALEICNKGIDKSNQFKLLDVIHMLLELKIEIFCSLENYDDAKLTYSQFKSFCEITNNDKYFKISTINLEKSYPRLFE